MPTTESIWADLSEDLRRFIRRRVSNVHHAEDLLQETFVRIHRGIDTLADVERLRGWVYRIARNVIHDHFRSRGTTVALGDGDVAEPDEVLPVPTCGRSTEWLANLVERLPETYRDAVRLSEFDGLPQQQVAERFGLSLSGAKSRIQRGRAMLKQELEQCCEFQFDRRGNLMDVEPRGDCPVCHDGC